MEQSLHFPGHTLLSISVVAILATAGILLYVWRLKGSVGRREGLILGGLRLVAVAGILGAFFQPIARIEEVVRRRSLVLILVDESMSMQNRGAGDIPYAEQVAAFFRTHADHLAELEREHDVSYWAFATHARRVERAMLERPLAAEGGSTDLAWAIREALKGVAPGDVGGVLVLTDGLDNGELAVADRGAASGSRRNVETSVGPVYGLLTEASSSLPDVVLWDVSGLNYVVSRDAAEVTAEVKLFGVDVDTLSMTLSQDDRVLSTTAFTPAEILEGGVVKGAFFPREPGRHLVDVALSQAGEEISTENNQRTTVLNVVRDRIRVLHVAGHPSWDQRFLREYFRRRNDVEIVSFHTLRTPDTATPALDEETSLIPFPAEELFGKQIEGFDVIVLQDYDLVEADPDKLAKNIEAFVDAGGALLFVGGSYSFGARGTWPAHLDKLLPVAPPKPLAHGMAEGRFRVEVPADMQHHPLFGTQNLVDRIAYVPVLAVNRTEMAGMEAQMLLAAVPEGDASTSSRWPLLVTAARGRGRVAAVLTDTLWRWSFDPSLDPTWRGLMDGILAWLTRDPLSLPIRVQAMFPEVLPGGMQSAIVSGSGVGRVRVALERQGHSGAFEPMGDVRVVNLAEAPSMEVRMPIPRAGGYRLTVRSEDGGIEAAQDVFVAAPRIDELRLTRPSDVALKRLVTTNGGEVVPLASLDWSRLSLKPEIIARVGIVSDRPVWNHPLVLIVILLALGIEWYVERKVGYT